MERVQFAVRSLAANADYRRVPIISTVLVLIFTSVAVGVTLSRHRMSPNVIAVVVLTALMLMIPFYRWATLETAYPRSNRTFYMFVGGIVGWLLLATIVAAKSTPLDCTEGYTHVPLPPATFQYEPEPHVSAEPMLTLTGYEHDE